MFGNIKEGSMKDSAAGVTVPGPVGSQGRLLALPCVQFSSVSHVATSVPVALLPGFEAHCVIFVFPLFSSKVLAHLRCSINICGFALFETDGIT